MKLCVVFVLLNFLQTTDCIQTSIVRASMKVFMVMYFVQTSFGEIPSEGELFVHRGKAVMLFTKITVDNYKKEDRVVALYINGDINQRLIAVWVLESNIAIKWLDDYYARKIFMDANQNIWIYNVEENDVGLYAIKYGILNNLAGPEVKLTVLDELTEEEQVQKWLDDHPEIKEKYSSSSFSTEWLPLILMLAAIVLCVLGVILMLVVDELTEEEQVQKWLDDHPEIKEKYSSSSFSNEWLPLILSQAIVLTVILFLILLMILILRAQNVAAVKAIKSKTDELTEEEQVQKWLDDHREIKEEYSTIRRRAPINIPALRAD